MGLVVDCRIAFEMIICEYNHRLDRIDIKQDASLDKCKMNFEQKHNSR